jgi:hypothetical protein
MPEWVTEDMACSGYEALWTPFPANDFIEQFGPIHTDGHTQPDKYLLLVYEQDTFSLTPATFVEDGLMNEDLMGIDENEDSSPATLPLRIRRWNTRDKRKPWSRIRKWPRHCGKSGVKVYWLTGDLSELSRLSWTFNRIEDELVTEAGIDLD